MEKTMNIGFAVEALNTLNKVTNATGKAGFAVYKAIRILSEETQDFNKVREDLVKKYGEDMGDGKIGIKEGSDGYQKFIEEINPILSEEVKVNLTPLTEDEFEKLADDNLTARDYFLLEALLIPDKEEKVEDVEVTEA